jgi:site-specific DNA-methyltransferase (adenine-specific)
MIQITNEDNMELMARYPDNYFDLAIVDPPYGIDIEQRVFKDGKKWDSEHQKKNTLMNCFVFQKIKLFGGGIILLKIFTQQNAF